MTLFHRDSIENPQFGPSFPRATFGASPPPLQRCSVWYVLTPPIPVFNVAFSGIVPKTRYPPLAEGCRSSTPSTARGVAGEAASQTVSRYTACSSRMSEFFVARHATRTERTANSLRAKGTLDREPRSSTPCDMRFPRNTGKMAFLEGFSLKKAIFFVSRGKNRMSQGVENQGSLISVPWPSGLLPSVDFPSNLFVLLADLG